MGINGKKVDNIIQFARVIYPRIMSVLIAGLMVLATISMAVTPASAQGCATPPSGMVSWWSADGNANDIQNGNHGTLQNGATFAAGNVGQGFFFDGVDDKVLIGNPTNLRLQDFTIDAWIKLNTLTISGFAERIAGYSIGGYGFFLAGPSVVNANGASAVRQLSLDKPGFDMVAAPLAVNDIGWHHVAVTKSGGTVTFYLDGVPGAAQRGGSPIASYNPGFVFNTNFALGSLADQDQPFPGLLDEVEVFNRALSASEIQVIFNAGSDGNCKVSATTVPPTTVPPTTVPPTTVPPTTAPPTTAPPTAVPTTLVTAAPTPIIIVITAAPTQPPATTQAPTATPVQAKFRVPPTVRLRPVTDVIETDQDGIIELYMDNPSLNDVVLKVDARISVPSGFHVSGQGFALAGGAGTAYGIFEVPPGTARTIAVLIKADKNARIGSHTLQFSGLYYPGDNKDNYQPLSLTYSVTVKAPSNVIPTPQPTTIIQTPVPPTPGFGLLLAVISIFVIACLRSKK